MTRYYKSRHLESPTVYVQEEGQWRGYAPNGALQRSTGSLPEVIIARTEEITAEEATAFIAVWRARAQRIQQQRAEATEAAPPEPRGGDPSSSPDASPTSRAPTRFLRSPRSRHWLPYAVGGAAIVIVVVVLALLAATGNLGTGTKATTSSPGGTNRASTRAVKVAPGDLVATVGGQPISRQQLEQQIADFEAQYSGQIPDKKASPARYKLFQEDVLDYLVTYQLVSEKASQLNVAVTGQDVQSEMALILKVSFGGDQAKFDNAVRQQGLTMDQFERIYRQSMLFNKVYGAVTKDVTVSDGDVQAYYNKHASDSYAGKSLDDAKAEIEGTLLGNKQEQVWSAWINQQKQVVGVTYANGWTAPSTTDALVP